MATFIEVDMAIPVTKGEQTGTNPDGSPIIKAKTNWKGGKITFDTEQIAMYSKYFDQNKSNGNGGFDNDKVSVSLGMVGFVFDGTVSQFETAAGL